GPDCRPRRQDRRPPRSRSGEEAAAEGKLPGAEGPDQGQRLKGPDRNRRTGGSDDRKDREALAPRLRRSEGEAQLEARKPARLPRIEARKRPRRHRRDAGGLNAGAESAITRDMRG